jgi:hypothetical protein
MIARARTAQRHWAKALKIQRGAAHFRGRIPAHPVLCSFNGLTWIPRYTGQTLSKFNCGYPYIVTRWSRF